MITRSDVHAAAARIAGRIRRTPLIEADPAAFAPPGSAPAARMWLKLEQTQHTGSFKARGAFNRLLTAADEGPLPAAGAVAASGGNAGLAIAYAARSLGVPAEVYVPRNAPPVKVAKLRALGATVVQVGDRYAHAYEAAVERAAGTGALFCHPYDQPEICAGQGTLGLELLEQAEQAEHAAQDGRTAQTGETGQTGDTGQADNTGRAGNTGRAEDTGRADNTGRAEIDTVLLAVGGGGLMAGVATALEGRATVVGVEPETIPTLHDALHAGKPVDVEVSGVAADSLGASRIGGIALATATRAGVRSVLVTDDAIVAARRLLWDEYHLAVEHGTAAAVAALHTGAYAPGPGERVALVLCGANTDPSDLVTGP